MVRRDRRGHGFQGKRHLNADMAEELTPWFAIDFATVLSGTNPVHAYTTVILQIRDSEVLFLAFDRVAFPELPSFPDDVHQEHVCSHLLLHPRFLVR